jgi:hypothetical protein
MDYLDKDNAGFISGLANELMDNKGLLGQTGYDTSRLMKIIDRLVDIKWKLDDEEKKKQDNTPCVKAAKTS